LTEDLLERVERPGQYLGNEWGASRKPFDQAEVKLTLAFPDMYELGMSNFGLKILYQIVNKQPNLLVDRAYAPAVDMEALLRERSIPLWGWESRRPMRDFELIGFSLQYELTYTNVLNMLDLAQLPIKAGDRKTLFPLVFGGGPSAVNPEPMSDFMDFFIIGDGEEAVPAAMQLVADFKRKQNRQDETFARKHLLWQLATQIPGCYVPAFYSVGVSSPVPKPREIVDIFSVDEISRLAETVRNSVLPERVFRQVQPLTDENQPTNNLVPYLNLVHDRETLEVRRGCDRGCRFCQPGYTFLPVRERSADDLLRLSTTALEKSGHEEYSMLSLCVSDYTSLHESVRALNREHSEKRTSLSFPSQRVDRMNLDLAEELKVVRKSGITLAPEAGSERLRAVINKGLSHQQIISAIEAAYQSGWSSVKLYFMCGLPTEKDEDLIAIVEILKEADRHCRVIKKNNPAKYRRDLELTCTISNFVPKPFTPFQWFGQFTPEETTRKHKVLREALKNSGLRRVQLNITDPQISLLEVVISRGGRELGELIARAYQSGAIFDAWDDRFKPQLWHDAAKSLGFTLEAVGCTDRVVGSEQPWDIVHIGLNNWWMVKEWEKAVATLETPPCTENTCHACGVCTELETTHKLAKPKSEVMKRNPFVKELDANTKNEENHPSLFFLKPQTTQTSIASSIPEADVEGNIRIRFRFTKLGDLRFISHLDLAALLARAARRASVRLAYTQGFNPHPKLNLAAPLALFQESVGEIAEIDLTENIDVIAFIENMNAKLPAEVQILEAAVVPAKASGAALQARLGGASYRASVNPLTLKDGNEAEIEKLKQSVQVRLTEIMNSEDFIVSTVVPLIPSSSYKKTSDDKSELATPLPKQKNIRAAIKSMSVALDEPLTLVLELAHGSKLHVKPTDVLTNILATELNSQINWKLQRLQLKADSGEDLFTV